eukprot:9927877-Alexandrium_andersonii.AAC.1
MKLRQGLRDEDADRVGAERDVPAPTLAQAHPPLEGCQKVIGPGRPYVGIELWGIGKGSRHDQ